MQVIGVPDKQYGEEIMACIILKPGETATEEEIRELCRHPYGQAQSAPLRGLCGSFPMNAAGKILKYKMREQAVEMLNLQAANAIETA